MSLIRQNRSFRGLLGAQFFGAFNDNLFKALILLMAARILFPGEDKQALATITFALPFVLFSGIAGDLSERYSKRSIVVRMKIAEIFIMAAGLVALQTKSWEMLLGVLFVMGTQSAFFGPSKYGVIPEIVKTDRLLRANGLIAMTTFMGVLLGTALAGWLLDNLLDTLWITGGICMVLAVVGTLLARTMAPLEPTQPDLPIPKSPFGSLWKTIGSLRAQEGLFPIVLLYSLFWFDGSVIQQSINGLGAPGFLDIPLDQNWKISMLQVTLALTIMVGSLTAPTAAKHFTEAKITIFGAVGMVVAQLALLIIGPVVQGATAYPIAVVIFAVMGFCGAFFVVPLQTFLQHGPPPGMRGQTFAVNNFMNWVAILLGGVWYFGVKFISPTVLQAGAGLVLLSYLLLRLKWVKQLRIG